MNEAPTIESLLSRAGARPGRDGWIWRGLPVRPRSASAAEVERLRALLLRLADLPDPVPTAEIHITRHVASRSGVVLVPMCSHAEAEAILALAGDSFQLYFDRDRAGMCILGADASGAPLLLEHRLPRVSLDDHAGLPGRSAAFVLPDAIVSDAGRRADKSARLRPYLRCPKCRERPPLEDARGALCCTACRTLFPVRDGVPVLLADDALSGEPGPDPPSSNSYSRMALQLFARFRGVDSGERGLVLDCGSGAPVESLDDVCHLEIVRYPNVDVVASSERLPFAEDTFDAVVCESVLEHVPDPWRVAEELHRVLRPGGVILVDAPFVAPFHAYPNHFHNFTQSGLDRLLSRFERLDGGIQPHQEPWLAIGWILRLVREGLPDESLRAQLDATTVGELLDGVSRGARSRLASTSTAGSRCWPGTEWARSRPAGRFGSRMAGAPPRLP